MASPTESRSLTERPYRLVKVDPETGEEVPFDFGESVVEFLRWRDEGHMTEREMKLMTMRARELRGPSGTIYRW